MRTSIVCGGKKKRHNSLPYRLHKETSPWRQGLFLEACDKSVSDGVFLKLLLTSSDSFLHAGFYLCLLSCNIPPDCSNASPVFNKGADANIWCATAGVFFGSLLPLTGRQREHSKQKAGSLNRPLTRSRLPRPNRLFLVSSEGPLWAAGGRSARRVLGWPFGSILTHLHFTFRCDV